MPSIALPVSLRGQLLSGTRTIAFSPVSLFSANEPGVWFDPSDLTTLFADPAGTTPVTTPGQTVGLMLDKSKGLALGPELVLNGDFAANLNDWPSNISATWDAGSALLSATSASAQLAQSFSTVVGRTYRLNYQFVAGNPGNSLVRLGTAANDGSILNLGMSAGPGSFSRVFVATSTTTWVTLFVAYPSVSITGKWDNISVRELAGNHATQAITAARPTYSIEPVGGRRNLLTFSEQLDNPIWVKPAGTTTISSNTATAPDGTVTADLVTATAGSACHYVYQLVSTSGSVTFTVYAKAGTTNWLGLGSGYTNGTETAWFDLATGTRGSVASGGTSTMDPVEGYPGWWRCSHTRSSWTGGSAMPFVTNANGAATFNAVGTENLLIWGAQLELGSTATPYQRVTTQHDVTEAGVASVGYLWFDGVSNNMVTSSVNFTSTNKMTAFAGYRAIEKTGSTLMLELSTNAFTSSGAFSFNQGPQAATTGFGALMNTGSGIGAQTTPLTIPYTSVASLKLDSALVGLTNEISLRMDGVAVALPVNSGGDSGTGNFGNYPFYIGARSGNIAPFKGHIYSLIARGAATDAPTIASTEIWVGDKTGIDIAKNISTTIYTRSGDTILDRANSTIERRA